MAGYNIYSDIEIQALLILLDAVGCDLKPHQVDRSQTLLSIGYDDGCWFLSVHDRVKREMEFDILADGTELQRLHGSVALRNSITVGMFLDRINECLESYLYRQV